MQTAGSSHQIMPSRLLILCLSCLVSFCAWSQPDASTFQAETVTSPNRSPIMQLFELATPEYHTFSHVAGTKVSLQLEVANYLSRSGETLDEELFIDGETWITTLHIAHQLSADLRLNFQASRRGHGEGISDRFIYHFHDALQLPQNGRTNDFHDRLLWRLDTRDTVLLQLDSATSAFGDLKLGLAWQSNTGDQWHAHIALPTGDFDKQTGNEGIDIGMAWAAQNPDWLRKRSWLQQSTLALWYGAGIGWVDQPEELYTLGVRSWHITLRGGMGWQALPSWRLKIQLDSHTPLYDTNIRELGWMPVQISLASKHNISSNTEFEFSLIEDLRPRVTPDIVFNMALSHAL